MLAPAADFSHGPLEPPARACRTRSSSTFAPTVAIPTVPSVSMIDEEIKIDPPLTIAVVALKLSPEYGLAKWELTALVITDVSLQAGIFA